MPEKDDVSSGKGRFVGAGTVIGAETVVGAGAGAGVMATGAPTGRFGTRAAVAPNDKVASTDKVTTTDRGASTTGRIPPPVVTPPAVAPPVVVPPVVAPPVGTAGPNLDPTDATTKVGTRDKVSATSRKDEPTTTVGAPGTGSEPANGDGSPKAPKRRFVGAAAVSGLPGAGAEGTPGGSAGGRGGDPATGGTGGGGDGSGPTPPQEERDNLAPKVPTRGRRQRRVSGRLVILLVVLLLIIGAAGGWYYKRHHTASHPSNPSAAQTQADGLLAEHIGVQATDLGGWTKTPGSPGNAFAPVTTTSPTATSTATKASVALAQCLHLPTLDVNRAFGGPSVTRLAQSGTPIYVDPGVPTTTVSSVVDVMRGPKSEHADFQVFSKPSLFATCYGSYATTVLPYTGSGAAAPFTSVTVQPVTVPAPASSRVHAEAFDITRTGSGTSEVTTAVAIYGGRIQATLAMTSATAFPPTVESSLLTALDGRVAGSLAS
jgi:hypothetical protein